MTRGQGDGDGGNASDAGDGGKPDKKDDAGGQLSREANSPDSNSISRNSNSIRNETGSAENGGEGGEGGGEGGEGGSAEQPCNEEEEQEEERPVRSEPKRDNDRDYEWPIFFDDPFVKIGASGGSGTEVRSAGGTPARAEDVASAGGTAVVKPMYDISVR
jgi:hypothetical protein